MDQSLSNCKKPKRPSFGTPEGCDLDEMVVDYRSRYLDKIEDGLSQLSTYTDFICGNANIKEADAGIKKYCKDIHQYRMPAGTIREANEELKKANLEQYDSFAKIHETVNNVSRKIDHFGRLAVYDFSMRYCYNKGMRPDGVYLHAGVVDGAKELQKMGYQLKIVDLGERGSMIELSSLPPQIADLGTLHAECFLCIYKDLLAKLAESKSKSNK